MGDPVFNNYFHLSYAMFVNKLLPAPFATDCISYKALRFESREHCVDLCEIQGITDVLGKVLMHNRCRRC